MDQTGHGPHRIGPAAEAEEVDLVPGLVGAGEKRVGGDHILTDSQADGRVEPPAEILAHNRDGGWINKGADAAVVVGNLVLVALQHAKEPQDVGRVGGDFVVGAVAANDDVFGHWRTLSS